MRAVLDPNVLISSIIAGTGTPAQLVARWRSGSFDLVVSEQLLAELEKVLRYERLRKFVDPVEASELLAILNSEAKPLPDPETTGSPAVEDPDDAYLVALARAERAALVSGDRHLLDLAESMPVYSPRQFLVLLDENG